MCWHDYSGDYWLPLTIWPHHVAVCTRSDEGCRQRDDWYWHGILCRNGECFSFLSYYILAYTAEVRFNGQLGGLLVGTHVFYVPISRLTTQKVLGSMDTGGQLLAPAVGTQRALVKFPVAPWKTLLQCNDMIVMTLDHLNLQLLQTKYFKCYNLRINCQWGLDPWQMVMGQHPALLSDGCRAPM